MCCAILFPDAGLYLQLFGSLQLPLVGGGQGLPSIEPQAGPHQGAVQCKPGAAMAFYYHVVFTAFHELVHPGVHIYLVRQSL